MKELVGKMDFDLGTLSPMAYFDEGSTTIKVSEHYSYWNQEEIFNRIFTVLVHNDNPQEPPSCDNKRRVSFVENTLLSLSAPSRHTSFLLKLSLQRTKQTITAEKVGEYVCIFLTWSTVQVLKLHIPGYITDCLLTLLFLFSTYCITDFLKGFCASPNIYNHCA